jgi:leucyl/phenylalanyl-tRNA--protein transferase
VAVFFLGSERSFPPVEWADQDGLLAIGGDLSPSRLLLAYGSGIFPWYNEESPILWWAPFPRPLIFPSQIHISRSLRRILKQNKFKVTFDQDFKQVILSCAQVHKEKDGGTWLLPEMIEAYYKLHLLGFAHSVEVWLKGKLVGGLYGVSLGRAFFGESMFYLEPNASKVGMVHLARFLAKNKFYFIDCQQKTTHVVRFGAVEVERKEYFVWLKKALAHPTLKSWVSPS